MINHALNYAANGFAVFPVYEPIHQGLLQVLNCSCGKMDCRGKHPRTPNGCNDATTDVNIIKEWWTKWPNANIGLATGKINKLAVVDLDGPEGINSGNRLGLYSMVSVLTGNGKQLYYSDPSGSLSNSVKKLSAGLDTRGTGGYVLAPPSLHPNGKLYMWENASLFTAALFPLPSNFTGETSTVSHSTNYVQKAPDWISNALEDMKKGHIHNTLISVLGKFRTHNFSEEDTYKLLQPYALLNGKPFEGLRAKIAEIWKRYPTNKPIEIRTETIETFLEDIKEPEWICKPFFAKKSIGFVVGLPETLKTWLSIDLAVECARGGGLWLGLFQTIGCKTLFIDQERWKGETQRRFQSILSAKGLISTGLKDRLYMKCGTTIRLNLDSSFQAFRNELLEMRPELIVVDSFATFHTAPENDRSEIQKVLERIKELRNEIGCTFLFINHESKMAYPNGEDKGEPTVGTMVGSIGIPAAAEFCLTVRKVETNTSMIWHTKSTLAQKSKSFYASVVDVATGIEVRGLND
jgi:Bifunctional DNA primase/polymerase, N-terminal/AAA domain